MSKKVTHKFYRPGTLAEKGTKISLKTQPYINGIIFDTQDPISSFHYYLMMMKAILDEYEVFRNIPGAKEAIHSTLNLNSGITGQLKLLLSFLTQSPIEITLKEQPVNNDILAELEVTQTTGGQNE